MYFLHNCVLLIRHFLHPTAALFNFTNSTGADVNSSYVDGTFLKVAVLPSGYGVGNGHLNSNATTNTTTTAFNTTTPLSPSTESAQQPAQPSPEAPQQRKTSLLPNPSPLPNPATSTPNQPPSKTSHQDTANEPTSSPPSQGQGPSPANPATQVPSFTVSAGTDTFIATPKPLSQYIINSATLTPGGSITVNNVPIALPTHVSFIVIGSSTVPFNFSPSPVASASDSNGGVITVANTPLSYQSAGSAFIIDGSNTVTAGGTVTINSVPIYLPPSGSSIIIGSSTVPLKSSPSLARPLMTPGPLLKGDETLTPGSVTTIADIPISFGSALIADGSITLTPGSTATLGNTPVFLPTSGSFIVVGSSTVRLGPSSKPATQIITSAPTIIQGQTLSPGSALTILGTPISLPSSGSAIVVGGTNTVPLNNAQTLSIGSQILTAFQAPSPAGVILGGQTLVPGGVITVAGKLVSIPTSGASLVIDGSNTIPFGSAQTISLGSQAFKISQFKTPARDINGHLITLGSQEINSVAQTISVGAQTFDISQLGTSALIIDGQTVARGSQAVISDVTLSVPTQGTDVIKDASTTAELGGAILSPLGYAPSTTRSESDAGSTQTGMSNGTTIAASRFTGGSIPSTFDSMWERWLVQIGVGLGCIWVCGWL
ncbi:hypothetical protein ACLMJK_004210 [Lecanora helva]